MSKVGKNKNKANPWFRYYYRGVCSILLTGLALLMFLFSWLSFITENDTTGYLFRVGNIALVALIYSVLFYICGRFLNAFKTGVERRIKQIASIIITIGLTDFIEILVSLAIINNYHFILELTLRYVVLAICQSIVLSLAVLIMVVFYRKLIRPLPVVLICGEYDNEIEKKMSQLPQKYHVEYSVHYDDPEVDLDDVICNSASILINDVPANVENAIIKKCFENDKRVYVVPKIADILLKSADSITVFDTPLYLCRNLGLSFGQRFIKRSVDIVLSLFGLIILSPVLIITALAIKIEDGGPVFFKQERVTKDGKHFMILKFRSMIVDAEKDGRPRPVGEKDNRITRVGNVIRACRIDELPQLINILSGDMSIVGPRPERYEHVEEYSKTIPEFRYREKVKGGLTGYAQVYGKYNTTALDKLKLDLMYISNYSLLLDVQIMFETVKILFQKESTEGFDDKTIKKIHDNNGRGDV
ncbi:MAG: sugar transferase [Saccharofermentans sp.]|nr:sugar transferase [Saccharofermentans sp.]